MPVYDYACPSCGPFTATRPMAEYDRPLACPGCRAEAPRAILGAPFFSGMDGARRAAFAVNERSADSPRRSGAAHAAGCGCCAPRRLSADDAGMKATASRPWMLGG
jgi:putative FmdB family regulatory protein